MKHLKHITTPLKADSHSNGNDNGGLFAKIEDLIGGLLFWKD